MYQDRNMIKLSQWFIILSPVPGIAGLPGYCGKVVFHVSYGIYKAFDFELSRSTLVFHHTCQHDVATSSPFGKFKFLVVASGCSTVFRQVNDTLTPMREHEERR